MNEQPTCKHVESGTPDFEGDGRAVTMSYCGRPARWQCRDGRVFCDGHAHRYADAGCRLMKSETEVRQ